MALRPVSELGLVDLTDLAEPAKAPAKAAQPKAATPARTTSGGAARRTAARAARAGMVVATWTAAGACGVMLGRAAVRR